MQTEDDDWAWPSPTPAAPEAHTPPLAGSSRVEDIAKELRSYTMDLADPEFLREGNELLREVLKLQSLLHYYCTSPDLARYTVEKELSRMEYSVESAGRAQKARKEHYFRGHEGDVLSPEGLTSLQALEVVWRAANQSVFAEAIQVLSEFGLTREEFHTGVAARKCSYTLDLDEATLEAQAELVVSVAAGEVRPNGSDRLELATLNLGLSFTPPILLSEPQRPQGHLVFEVKDARPCMLFDDALRSAAEVIVRDQDSLAALEREEKPPSSISERIISAIDAELEESNEEPKVEQQEGSGWLMDIGMGLVAGIGKAIGADKEEPLQLYRKDAEPG